MSESSNSIFLKGKEIALSFLFCFFCRRRFRSSCSQKNVETYLCVPAFQLASLGTRFADHTSSTAPESPGWTRAKRPYPQPTTTTHGPSATSANPACTPPAPATRAAAAAPARPRCLRSPRLPTRVRTSTVSLPLHRKTCPRIPGPPLRPPPRPGWTTRTPSSTKCRCRTA